MKKRQMIVGAAMAAAVWSAPLGAVEGGVQETLQGLARPMEMVEASPAKRAETLPVLAYLPGGTDAFLVVSQPEVFRSLAMLSAEQGEEEAAKLLSCIGQLAISAGEGSAASLRQLMAAFSAVMQREVLDDMAEQWSSEAKPLAREVFHQVVGELIRQRGEEISRLSRDLHVSPVYLAVKAAPGRAEEFAELCGAVEEGVRQLPGEESPWKTVEWEGFTGARVPLRALLDVTQVAMLEEPVLRVTEEMEVHVLLRRQGDVLLAVICQSPADIALPKDSADSLQATPALAQADAHVDSLWAAAWVSPEMLQGLTALSRGRASYPQVDAVVETFRRLAAADVPNSKTYEAAAESLDRLANKMLPELPEIKAPLTLQVWAQEGGKLQMEMTSDAAGFAFSAGELRYAEEAAAADTALYAESTDFTAPYMPTADTSLDTYLSIAQGLTLTQREERQDALSGGLQMAELMRGELAGLHEALMTVRSGLSAPYALLVKETEQPLRHHGKRRKVQKVPAVAFCSAVQSRAALSDGWDKMMTVASGLAMKLYGSAGVISALPIVGRKLNETAVSYVLEGVSMFLPPGVEPQLTVDDTALALSSSLELGPQLVQSERKGMPFAGAVCALQVRPVVSMATQSELQANIATAFVKGVYMVTTVQNGLMITRLLVDR